MQTRREFLVSSALATAAVGLPSVAFAQSQDSITIAIGDEPTTSDQTVAWTGVDYNTIENYAEYLFPRDTGGEIVPGLAAEWKYSEDGKTLDVALRDDVAFHSGDKFTAADVVFSYERGMEESRTVANRLRSLDRIEVKDDYHLTFHFKNPDVTFLPNRGAAMMASKAYFDRVGEEEFSRNPVGTGPYKFSSYAVGEYVEVERFDDYWGAVPPIARAKFIFVPEETTRVASLQAGETDLIMACPYYAVKGFDAVGDFKTVKLPVNHPTMSIVFSTQNPEDPWHDRRVRLALAHAVDTDAIINGVLFGVPQRLAFLAPYEVGYDPDLKPYPYDLAKAKALLAEAGYPDGFEMELNYAITGRVQMNPQVAEAVAAYFEAVGVRTKLVGEEWEAYRSKYNAAKEPGSSYVALFTHGRAGSPDPTYNLGLFFRTGGPISIYNNPELDAINAEATATMDEEKRGELIKKAVRLIHEEVPSFPIYNNFAVYAMKSNVNFVPTQGFNFDLVLVKDMSFT
ncbi:ABC transporter substrate-binding protein [Chelativorans alearense]|uniref:ABC transporter substrate-binding protein n=1 Tax=Chelativorans alearense TaxID=2681495 RepID=UPI0013D60135|nr:ABC transporter substrate-binding protein [Chelativorans alearense]